MSDSKLPIGEMNNPISVFISNVYSEGYNEGFAKGKETVKVETVIDYEHVRQVESELVQSYEKQLAELRIKHGVEYAKLNDVFEHRRNGDQDKIRKLENELTKCRQKLK